MSQASEMEQEQAAREFKPCCIHRIDCAGVAQTRRAQAHRQAPTFVLLRSGN